MVNHCDPPIIHELGSTERMRVTRELHDIEQSLAILGVQMLRAGKAVSGLPGASHPGLSELSDKLKEIGGRVRRLSRELHSSRLKSFDLAAAVSQHCSSAREKSGIPVTCHCQAVPPDLDGLLALSILRVIQEAVDNAGKHSHAKSIRVELQGSSRDIRVLVSDDGIGFDVEEAKLAAGLGLISMRERIHLAGGEFAVASGSGKGTRISAQVPLNLETSATTA